MFDGRIVDNVLAHHVVITPGLIPYCNGCLLFTLELISGNEIATQDVLIIIFINTRHSHSNEAIQLRA